MNEEPGLLEVQENNTMITFGRKLKHLRQKNHLTQKELGIAVGFPDSCADVRIAQYEGDVRTPKEDLNTEMRQRIFRCLSFIIFFGNN